MDGGAADGEDGRRRLLAEARRLASPGGRAELGLCLAEGLRPVERAVRRGWRLRALLVDERRLAGAAAVPSSGGPSEEPLAALLAELETRGVGPTPVPSAELAALTAGRDEGGVVGLVETGPPPDLHAVVSAARTLLVAVELNDPGNAGALVRTAHALGADAFVSAGGTDPFHPRAVRISRGSVFALPALQTPSAGELLDELAAAGVRTLGAVTRGGTPARPGAFGPPPRALVLGSEARGLPEEVAERLDTRLSLPMVEGVDSLSVHGAAAALLAVLALEGS